MNGLPLWRLGLKREWEGYLPGITPEYCPRLSSPSSEWDGEGDVSGCRGTQCVLEKEEQFKKRQCCEINMAQQFKHHGAQHARAGATRLLAVFMPQRSFSASENEWQQWKRRGPSANMRRIKNALWAWQLINRREAVHPWPSIAFSTAQVEHQSVFCLLVECAVKRMTCFLLPRSLTVHVVYLFAHPNPQPDVDLLFPSSSLSHH